MKKERCNAAGAVASVFAKLTLAMEIYAHLVVIVTAWQFTAFVVPLYLLIHLAMTVVILGEPMSTMFWSPLLWLVPVGGSRIFEQEKPRRVLCSLVRKVSALMVYLQPLFGMLSSVHGVRIAMVTAGRVPVWRYPCLRDLAAVAAAAVVGPRPRHLPRGLRELQRLPQEVPVVPKRWVQCSWPQTAR